MNYHQKQFLEKIFIILTFSLNLIGGKKLCITINTMTKYNRKRVLNYYHTWLQVANGRSFEKLKIGRAHV